MFAYDALLETDESSDRFVPILPDGVW